MSPQDQIQSILKNHNSFLIASHINPDGDAIGSMLAFAIMLETLDKKFDLYNESGMPDRFSWLHLPKPILQKVDPNNYEWIIILDCGNKDRVGNKIQNRLNPLKIINIDHHLGNPEYGKFNWIEPLCSSVGEMTAHLAKDMGFNLSSSLGEALYLAINTDTGSFSYSNTKPTTLEIVSEILQQGLNLDKFNSRLHRQWSLNKVHLHGKAMQGCYKYAQGQIGVIKVTQTLLQETNTTIEDCEGLVNYARYIKGVIVALSLREEDSYRTKFSLRSWGEVDVRSIASALDGGGHSNAAGGIVNLSMKDAEQKIVRVIESSLKQAKDQQLSYAKLNNQI